MSTRFEILQGEWKARSRELADWGLERLVNRRDVWGQYSTPSVKERSEGKKTYKALTLPQKSRRGDDMVTLDKLQRHFTGFRINHLIGLHAASPESTSRWMAIDIDLHDVEAVDAEDGARRNEAAAVAWWERLQGEGYDPVLIDSNGHGGFHLWVLFAQPAPTPHVYAFAQALVSEWRQLNLDAPPETYPKGPKVEGDKLGAWLRLPGRHHTFDHFSRVWSGEPWLDEPWLEGDAAIDLMLQNQGGPPPPVPEGEVEKVTWPKDAPRKRPDFGTPGRRGRVCVDLDGVLTRYDGWQGLNHLGPPVDGAVEFTRALAEFADLVIWTSRFSEMRSASMPVADLEVLIRRWLDEHGMVYHEIFTGRGKPLAHAYIDDRAVSCRPQEDGPAAFVAAEESVRRLCDAPREE